MWLFDFFFDLLFPSSCIGCSTALTGNSIVCDPCLESIPLQKRYYSTPLYTLAGAARYENRIVQELIKQLKFHSRRCAAVPLASLMNRYLEKIGLDCEACIMVPIPLSARRLRERGYNQSLLIAAELARLRQLPIAEALVRTRNTQAQSTLAQEERVQNVRDCFQVTHPEEVCGKTVLLIDDVTTSGATLREATAALHGAGAARVIAVTAAVARKL